MVQHGHPLQQGDFHSTRETWPRNDRFPNISQDGRFTTPHPIHGRELTIEQALKECVHIPVKEFALAVVLENGEEKMYSSTSLKPYRQRFFSDKFKSDFSRSVRRASQSSMYQNTGYDVTNEFDLDGGHDALKSSGESSSGMSRNYQRKSRSDDSDEDGSSSARRKRVRPSLYPGQFRENSNEDAPLPVPVKRTQPLMIGNEAEVEKFYWVRFKDMQQSSCKVMGKAFVKLVEPKKQTHHPYTGGNDKAPPWWPATTGKNCVRHREPDHLLKPERIRLLVHILRLVVEPASKQHPSVAKLGLNVKKLEEVTMEAMSNWFNDKDHSENAAKKPFLKEIFKVARTEERYKNGEIDHTTSVPVTFGEGSVGDSGSDEEDEDLKHEDNEQDMIPVSAGMPTPESVVSPQMGSVQQSHLELEPNAMMGNRMRPIPVRQYTQPHMNDHFDSVMYQRSLLQQPQSPNFSEQARRASFTSTSNYNSPQQNIFTGWQSNSIVSAGQMSEPYYTTSPQTSVPPASASYQLPLLPSISQSHNPQMLPPPPPSSYDAMSNRPYESGAAHGSQMRTGSLGHQQQMHHGLPGMPLPDYLHDNMQFGQHDVDLKDEHHLHQSQ